MPPKVKITKEEVVHAAVEIVRQEGPQALNARNVAAALNCSTQPIFSNFATMEELHQATNEAAFGIYLDFLEREAQSGRYPVYKSYGMAYIRFAKEEKELFKLLFMCDREGEDISPKNDFNTSIEMMMQANGLSRERAELMHMEMWSCVHGIGTMMATSFLDLEWELVSQMLTDIYLGVRARHIAEETKNDSNQD